MVIVIVLNALCTYGTTYLGNLYIFIHISPGRTLEWIVDFDSSTWNIYFLQSCILYTYSSLFVKRFFTNILICMCTTTPLEILPSCLPPAYHYPFFSRKKLCLHVGSNFFSACTINKRRSMSHVVTISSLLRNFF